MNITFSIHISVELNKIYDVGMFGMGYTIYKKIRLFYLDNRDN